MMPVNEAILTAYLDGELPQEEQQWVERRLAESDDLQATLTQLRREISRVDEGLALLAPSTPHTEAVSIPSFSKNGDSHTISSAGDAPFFENDGIDTASVWGVDGASSANPSSTRLISRRSWVKVACKSSDSANRRSTHCAEK